jgi:hypothetical protein
MGEGASGPNPELAARANDGDAPAWQAEIVRHGPGVPMAVRHGPGAPGATFADQARETAEHLWRPPAPTIRHPPTVQPGQQAPQPLRQSVGAGQHAIYVTVTVQGSGHGTGSQTTTLQILSADQMVRIHQCHDPLLIDKCRRPAHFSATACGA